MSMQVTGTATTSRVKRILHLAGRPMTWLLVGAIRTYQLVISPMLGPRCRFYPSCSSYAVSSLRTHGPLKGTLLAGARICRCHPWNDGGLDPVPPKGAWRPEINADGTPRVKPGTDPRHLTDAGV